ncbi:3'-5' exoribonuclease [Pseudoxanthomonas sacheonensis]|uniref:3'-5' exoribonuclease n=1 Tax=Pseudoxanthomonas sacheonensis TaxID=443615 RepID=UPI0013D414C8|nr:3'-5' exoribonuclease [Pseudoxanthomonas sacheonensis]KAF1710170.1 hypothetical protein CSC73_05695 [Pseudoxanthomonas sacheonensis]
MTPTYLFLDTEWADAMGSELVSLALVSEDGALSFYAERAELPAAPTDFVRDVVYPLLDRGNAALSDEVITANLRAFLNSMQAPTIMADYPNDLLLLRHALSGFDMSDVQAQACGPIPRPVMTHMLKEGLTGMLVEEWFDANPEQRTRRHHALIDAHALRMAWLVATGRIPPPAWAKSAHRLLEP